MIQHELYWTLFGKNGSFNVESNMFHAESHTEKIEHLRSHGLPQCAFTHYNRVRNKQERDVKNYS